jgi:PAS domain S-box-containing protein
VEEITGPIQNLTGGKSRAAEREGTEGFYHRMIGEVKDYAIVGLDREGNVIEWNKGAEKIKGYKASEIFGKNFSLFYPAEDRAKGIPQMLLKKATEEGSVVAEG